AWLLKCRQKMPTPTNGVLQQLPRGLCDRTCCEIGVALAEPPYLWPSWQLNCSQQWQKAGSPKQAPPRPRTIPRRANGPAATTREQARARSGCPDQSAQSELQQASPLDSTVAPGSSSFSGLAIQHK